MQSQIRKIHYQYLWRHANSVCGSGCRGCDAQTTTAFERLWGNLVARTTATKTATATAATTTTTATAAKAAAAILARFGLVDRQVAAIDFLAIELGNRRIAF